MDPLSGLGAAGAPNAFAAMRAQSMPAPKISTQEIADLGSIGVAQPERVGGTGNFADVLTSMVREVNAKQAAASEAVGGVLAGEGVPLHQAVIAMEEASVSFQLMVEVRNKLVESYQELMRMQI